MTILQVLAIITFLVIGVLSYQEMEFKLRPNDDSAASLTRNPSLLDMFLNFLLQLLISVFSAIVILLQLIREGLNLITASLGIKK